MNVHKTLATFTALGALTLPGTATAQDEPLVLPDRSEVAAGETFVAEIFRDWQIRCIRSEGDIAPDRCEMFQLLEEENGNPVAEFRISAPLINEDGAIANATILTPLDTLLSPGLQLQIDEEEPAVLPYAFCRPVGCFVQISLTEDNLGLFQNGADAQVVIFALTRDELGQIGGVPVPTSASLRGFTAAYENLVERRDEIIAFIEEQEGAAAEEDGAASE
ncbi:invasion associated locus B family protein [Gymnodinialimonas ulvae]|uniref:invasion associated locus B family protein n=1 Tax=Gymnodinialimonas ulvae TaxID=3126504 RepID=UPI0030EFA586